MEMLDANTILQIERVLKENSKRGVLKTKEILKIIKAKGFYSCFYYDAVNNISTEDYQLFLSSVVGTERQIKHEGESVDYRDTSIAHALAEKTPVIQIKNDHKQTEQLKKHTDLLEVTDKNRVHVPIYYEEMFIGALSCSWNGDITLCEEQLSFFIIIGSMISRYWQVSNEILANKILKELQKSILNCTGQTKLDIVLERVGLLIRDALNVKVVSLFHYDWYSSRLTKIQECHSALVSGVSLNESYESGCFLTGKAWEDSSYRHIVDFNEFLCAYKQHVCIDSLNHHSDLIGNIKTILYSSFGTKSNYFLRLMNRDDRPNFPLFSSHKIILKFISNHIDELVNEIIDENRVFRLQQVAKTAISNITSLDITIAETKSALINECVGDLGVMAYSQKDIHFTHKYFTNAIYKKSISQFCTWENDRFYRDCINVKGITSLKIGDYEERTKENHLVNILFLNKINFVVIVPFSSIRINGFLLIPSPENTRGTTKSFLNRLPKFHLESLTAYAGLIGGCVESADSHLTSDNARRLIGQIGHEIQGPVAELGQTAIETIYETFENLNDIDFIDDALRNKIKISLNKNELLATKQMNEIRKLMNIALDMAQETNGSLQVNFEEFDFNVLLQGAARESKRDEYVDYRGVGHKVDIIFNESCMKMNQYIGDEQLIHKVFVNVLRNAIKYSLPRYKGRSIVINVNGIPQSSQYIIHVINWGVPLEENIINKIFNAFERGDSHDRLKARRGMGLGLYIARRFLAAHKGTIFCKQSTPTLDDPRRKNIEGWNTVFEIRLPFGLPRGTFDDQS